MKRFIFILAAALLLSVPAQAQFQVEKAPTDEQLPRVTMMMNTQNFLYRYGSDWYIVLENTYKPDGLVYLYLGGDDATVMKSVHQLRQLVEDLKKGQIINLSAEKGDACKARLYVTADGVEGLEIYTERRLGSCPLYTNAIVAAESELRQEIIERRKKERENVTK